MILGTFSKVRPILLEMKPDLEQHHPNVLELSIPMKPIDWRLCLVADKEAAGTRDLVAIVEEAAGAGATLIQLRAKNCETREFLDLAIRISGFLKPLGIPLIINDRADIALACDARGLHLGQQDIPLLFARKILGPNRLIGISVNTIEEAQSAEKQGADYLGVGPVFFTSSKDKIPAILGLEGLRAIREKVGIPILAIGGVDRQNAAAVMSSGADGIAVISAILGEGDIEKATKSLLSVLS
jgi:thiamine-phosphate pyrophosphorylase